MEIRTLGPPVRRTTLSCCTPSAWTSTRSRRNPGWSISRQPPRRLGSRDPERCGPLGADPGRGFGSREKRCTARIRETASCRSGSRHWNLFCSRVSFPGRQRRATSSAGRAPRPAGCVSGSSSGPPQARGIGMPNTWTLPVPHACREHIGSPEPLPELDVVAVRVADLRS
jgi:hypothetical protein